VKPRMDPIIDSDQDNSNDGFPRTDDESRENGHFPDDYGYEYSSPPPSLYHASHCLTQHYAAADHLDGEPPGLHQAGHHQPVRDIEDQHCLLLH